MPKREREIMLALRRAALLRGLPTPILARIAKSATIINALRGDHLYGAGDPSRGLYVVISGRITVSVSISVGVSKVTEIVGGGGNLGLAAAVLGVPHAETAGAVTDSELLLIAREALFTAQAPELALRLLSALGRQVCELVADIKAYSLHSGRERVADYLLQLAALNGASVAALTLPAKKSIIASRLNLTPEYFSRMLHELTSASAIVVNGRQITIIDPHGLRKAYA